MRIDRRLAMLLIAAAVVALDRWSKLTVEAHLRLGEHVAVVPGFFWISHVLNTGAAFSMFEEARSPILVRNALVAFSALAVLVVLAVLWRVGRTFSITSVALALILGGALGNLYDRIRFAFVVDFLEIHLGSYHFPDFNVADSCIVIGAGLLFVEMLLPQPRRD